MFTEEIRRCKVCNAILMPQNERKMRTDKQFCKPACKAYFQRNKQVATDTYLG